MPVRGFFIPVPLCPVIEQCNNGIFDAANNLGVHFDNECHNVVDRKFIIDQLRNTVVQLIDKVRCESLHNSRLFEDHVPVLVSGFPDVLIDRAIV